MVRMAMSPHTLVLQAVERDAVVHGGEHSDLLPGLHDERGHERGVAGSADRLRLSGRGPVHGRLC